MMMIEKTKCKIMNKTQKVCFHNEGFCMSTNGMKMKETNKNWGIVMRSNYR